MGIPQDSGLRNQLGQWLRPAVYLGHNLVTLAGAVLTTSSAFTLLAFWALLIVQGGAVRPYTGIIFFLILPGFFAAGLHHIPVGVFLPRPRVG